MSNNLVASKHEGYFKQSLGFTDTCSVCAKVARALAFSRRLSHETSPEGVDISDFTIGELVCGFDCFKRTADYIGLNPPFADKAPPPIDSATVVR